MGKMRALILLIIIAGIGVGSGCMVFAVGWALLGDDEMALFLALGSASLTASVAASVEPIIGLTASFTPHSR